MFRDVPECSMFRVLLTPFSQYARIPKSYGHDNCPCQLRVHFESQIGGCLTKRG